MSIYENNLIALSTVDKDLTDKLKSITTNEKYEVFVTDMEYLSDLNIVDNRDATAIDNSVDDINNKLKEFEEFDNYYALYFFGIGSGIFYKKLLNNAVHKKIYIFEPEIELLYIVFNLIDFSKDIVAHRLIINISHEMNLTKIKEIIDDNTAIYLKKYNLDIYSNYYDKYLEKVKELNSIILLFFKHVLQNKGNSLEDTLIGYKNSLNKMFYMFKRASITQLAGSVKNRKNAIMTATGPSLKKQLPLLKKNQDYFTILCVDASFPILVKAGIKPDIVLSMERGEATAKFYKETAKESFKDVVFLIATVCHDETFSAIEEKNGLIVPFLRADTHNIALGLDEWGYLGGGLSSANYLFNFANNADFENFVFIGQDLAYGKDGSSHSQGHVYGKDEIKDDKFVGYVPAYGGDGEVATMKYWKIFLNDLVVQIASSKRYKNMNIYNSTEGGARIVGSTEIPFKKYCDEILDTSAKKDNINLKPPTNNGIKNNTSMYLKKINESLKLAKSVKKQTRKTFLSIEQFLKKIKEFNREKLLKTVKDKEVEDLVQKIYDTRSKYAKPAFFNQFNTLFMSYLHHIDFDIAAVKTMREDTPEAIKLKKINYIKIHYEWLYRLGGSLEMIIEIIEDSLKKA